MRVSVLIPTYNGISLLEKCLHHLTGLDDFSQGDEILVVDNGSTDGTMALLEKMKKTLPRLRIIANRSNTGFAGAINQAARQARGKYLLVLNNDCFMEKTTLTRLLHYLEKENNEVATQPIVMNGDKIENIGYFVDTFIGKAMPVTNQALLVQSDERYLYGLSATCLLIRRDVFLKIGLFDESFHSYLEDVDLFIRLSQGGYLFGPTLDSRCDHRHMATSSKMGIYKQKQDLKNWLRIIGKNFTAIHIIRHFPFLFVERLRNFNGVIKAVIIKGL